MLGQTLIAVKLHGGCTAVHSLLCLLCTLRLLPGRRRCAPAGLPCLACSSSPCVSRQCQHLTDMYVDQMLDDVAA